MRSFPFWGRSEAHTPELPALPYNISQLLLVLLERYQISSVRGELPVARLAPLWVTIGTPYSGVLGLVTAPSASPSRAPGTAATPAVKAALWQPPEESKATRSVLSEARSPSLR